jgi:hypothetical protein
LESTITDLRAQLAGMQSLGIAFDTQTDMEGAGEYPWIHNKRAETAEAQLATAKAEYREIGLREALEVVMGCRQEDHEECLASQRMGHETDWDDIRAESIDKVENAILSRISQPAATTESEGKQ